MLKPLSFALVAATVLVASVNNPSTTLAKTCASKCGSRPIQFTPGQHIRVEVLNSTPNLIKIQKPLGLMQYP